MTVNQKTGTRKNSNTKVDYNVDLDKKYVKGKLPIKKGSTTTFEVNKNQKYKLAGSIPKNTKLVIVKKKKKQVKEET